MRLFGIYKSHSLYAFFKFIFDFIRICLGVVDGKVMYPTYRRAFNFHHVFHKKLYSISQCYITLYENYIHIVVTDFLHFLNTIHGGILLIFFNLILLQNRYTCTMVFFELTFTVKLRVSCFFFHKFYK